MVLPYRLISGLPCRHDINSAFLMQIINHSSTTVLLPINDSSRHMAAWHYKSRRK